MDTNAECGAEVSCESADPVDLILPRVGKLDDQNPSADWSDDELGKYAKQQDEQCEGAKKRMAIHRYREGHALTLAYVRIFGKKGRGAWGVFLQSHGISHSSDDRARKLYKMVKSEDDLDNLRIMEAYRQFGIETPRKKKGDSLITERKPRDLPGQDDGDAQGGEMNDDISHGNEDMTKEAALATIQQLAVDDPWKMLQEVVGVLGLGWSDVEVWAKVQAGTAPAKAVVQKPVANIVVSLEPITLRLGGRADRMQVVGAVEPCKGTVWVLVPLGNRPRLIRPR